jgi:glyoxylase-like metal-dependent hydrolase (beta-lactamase superfamily II)
MLIQKFTFNPFGENTYIVSDQDLCIIIDPGCMSHVEEKEICSYIDRKKLTPIEILLTHAHLDHIAGNAFLSQKYKIGIAMHPEDLPVLRRASHFAALYGLSIQESPEPSRFLNHGDIYRFGSIEMEVRFTPGHCPGEVCFIHHESRSVFAGDVLFSGSVGRTDLPGGDASLLRKSIEEQLLTLADNYTVYCGHGPETSIGSERAGIPFIFSQIN